MNDTGKVLVSQLTPINNKPLAQENSKNKSYTGKVFCSNLVKIILYQVLLKFKNY
jgi:hypothetical protein